MPFTPQISITMPFFNAESTIIEALQSVAAQTFHQFELIGVDDGSTDRSVELFRNFAQNDPRFKLYQREHQGVVPTANYAITQATCNLIARMDADDIMLPERLEKQYHYLQQNPEVSVVGTQVELFPEERITDGAREYIHWQNSCVTPNDITNNIFVELAIAHPTTLIRKECFENAGYYRDGDYPEDYELLLRLHQHGYKMGKVEQILMKWRDGDSRLTRTDERYSREAFDRIRAKYLKDDPRIHQPRPLVFWGAGRATRKRVSYLLNYDIAVDGWIDIDPKKIDKQYHGATVFSPDWLKQQSKPFVLGYVNNHGIREKIATYLNESGYTIGKDYLMVG